MSNSIRNLVFSSVGDRSRLEEFWLDKPRRRRFDLWLCYYGDGQEERFSRCADRYFARKGSKFENLYWVYQNYRHELEAYDAIFVLDDDIQLSTLDINLLFEILYRYDLWILQPSFGPGSRVSHAVTRRQEGGFLRYTNFIEMCVPLFKRTALLKFLEHYDSSAISWGSDYLYLWANGRDEPRRYAVIDAISCLNPNPPPGVPREIDRLMSSDDRIARWDTYSRKLGVPTWIGEDIAIVYEDGASPIDVAALTDCGPEARPTRIRAVTVEAGDDGYLCHWSQHQRAARLSESAILILSRCDGENQVAGMVGYVRNYYRVEGEAVRKMEQDVYELLDELYRMDLIRFLSTPGQAAPLWGRDYDRDPDLGSVAGFVANLRSRLTGLYCRAMSNITGRGRIRTVTVMTSDREPSYLEQTLATLPGELSAEIVWQTDRELERPGVVRTRRLNRGAHADAQYNYAQCLLVTSDGLIVEDDVKFSRDFFQHLQQVRRLLRDKPRYVVTLYSAYYPAERNTELHLVDCHIGFFFGTQAMLYDPVTAREFGRFLVDRIGVEPYDIAVRSYCVVHDLPLYRTSYSLVRHIGAQSTGLGVFHDCRNFVDDYIDIAV